MKIGPGNNKKIRAGQTAGSGKSGKAGKASAGQTRAKGHATSDHVEISVHAREVQEALDLAASAPEIRTEKVAPLKAAVEDGSYHRPSEAVAEKIVDEMKEMRRK
jgi:negative regulator of flagellin synthesis FlgM